MEIFVGRILFQYVVAKLFTSCYFFDAKKQDGSRLVLHLLCVLKFIPESPWCRSNNDRYRLGHSVVTELLLEAGQLKRGSRKKSTASVQDFSSLIYKLLKIWLLLLLWWWWWWWWCKSCLSSTNRQRCEWTRSLQESRKWDDDTVSICFTPTMAKSCKILAQNGILACFFGNVGHGV